MDRRILPLSESIAEEKVTYNVVYRPIGLEFSQVISLLPVFHQTLLAQQRPGAGREYS
jgi:hypothetical protein